MTQLFNVARSSLRVHNVPVAISRRCRQGHYRMWPEVSNQTIQPFTDLLLHDMGPGLADNRPDFLASGSEWRTPAAVGYRIGQSGQRAHQLSPRRSGERVARGNSCGTAGKQNNHVRQFRGCPQVTGTHSLLFWNRCSIHGSKFTLPLRQKQSVVRGSFGCPLG